MNSDLIFYIVSGRKWPKLIHNGLFKPEELEENGRIECIPTDRVNEVLNSQFSGRKNMFILVIDTTRLMTRPKKDGDHYVVEGAINIDAILDKIRVDSDKEGRFDVDISVN